MRSIIINNVDLMSEDEEKKLLQMLKRFNIEIEKKTI